MLISPPFLPPRATATEENWINLAMTGDSAGQGAYPVSHDLGWHGGLHLEAPAGGTSGVLPVVAIADGTVIYCRKPTNKNDSPQDPLNYSGGWTSDGCVVIKHETDIGTGDNAKVVFYSVIMHLHALRANIRPNAKIYRKDELGQAGYIQGNPNKIHIEIICDGDNLHNLIGRWGNDFNGELDGRTDAVYGEIYFRLPIGTNVYKNQPADNILQPPATNLVVKTLDKVNIIGLRYHCGETPNPGGATLTTYLEDGSSIVNSQLEEVDSEYNLYKRATDISKAYQTAHAPKVPAPSAVYELLRFGRIINTDNETLDPVDTSHWRKIKYDGGEGWVNLNHGSINEFSDADFPPWKGWLMVNDDKDGDSRCDSELLKQWLDADGDGKIDHTEAVRITAEASIKAKLSKTICELPSEWAKSEITKRYSWLKESNDITEPLTDESFERLANHIEKLSFWEETGLETTLYHFDPREFIKHFRRCGWLSVEELAMSLPQYSYFPQAGTTRSYQTSHPISLLVAKSRFSAHYLSLNQCVRKYSLESKVRLAHFLAQTFIETDRWKVVSEYGSGTPVASIPMIQYYAAFYGRGVMQLTWAGNFEAYGDYRKFSNHVSGYEDNRITATSTHYWGDPTLRDSNGHIIGLDPSKPPRRWSPRYDPAIIKESFNANDSGGFYWVWKYIGQGNSNINRAADKGLTPTAVDRVSKLVNGGGFGYFERQAYVVYLERYLDDSTERLQTKTVLTPRANTSIVVNFAKPS